MEAGFLVSMSVSGERWQLSGNGTRVDPVL